MEAIVFSLVQYVSRALRLAKLFSTILFWFKVQRCHASKNVVVVSNPGGN